MSATSSAPRPRGDPSRAPRGRRPETSTGRAALDGRAAAVPARRLPKSPSGTSRRPPTTSMTPSETASIGRSWPPHTPPAVRLRGVVARARCRRGYHGGVGGVTARMTGPGFGGSALALPARYAGRRLDVMLERRRSRSSTDGASSPATPEPSTRRIRGAGSRWAAPRSDRRARPCAFRTRRFRVPVQWLGSACVTESFRTRL